MKVKDLILKLSSLDQELDVAFERGYGLYTVSRVSYSSAFKGKKTGMLYKHSNEDRQEEKVKLILLDGQL